MFKKILLPLLLSCPMVNSQVITPNFGTGANAFSIEFVQIGNLGNAADTSGNPNPAGSVSYTYNIGKYEISRDMINKANALGGLNITMADFSVSTPTIPYRGGNGADRPAPGISWYDAARFVNYLNTSSDRSAAYKFDVNGSFQLWSSSDDGYNANNKFRNSKALYFLPSVDEWYKAAYFDPAKNSGAGGYWLYTTQSNTAPSYSSGGTEANSAIYGGQTSPADIFNAGGLSAYGTMAQGGNLWEWLETANDLSNNDASELRAIRGGGFDNINTDSYQKSNSASASWGSQPTDGNIKNGFRIAMVPEPSAVSLLAVGLGGLAMMRRRRA
jgi:formylglycine-generating enzyme required for sulfatase activity